MVPVLVIDRDRDHLADSARVLASHGPLAARADSEALRRGHVALDVAAIVRQPFAPALLLDAVGRRLFRDLAA